MKVNQLLKKLEGLDPNMEVVVRGSDHNFFETMADVEGAVREEDGSLSESEDWDDESRERVLVIW